MVSKIYNKPFNGDAQPPLPFAYGSRHFMCFTTLTAGRALTERLAFNEENP